MSDTFVYVYGDSASKEIVMISSVQLEEMSSFVELQVEFDHPVTVNKSKYRLNLANDGLDVVFVTKDDVLQSVIRHRERMAEIGATLTIAVIMALAETHDAQQALAVLQAFNLKHALAKLEWWESNNMKIAADVALPDEDNDFWLDLDISPGLTFRAYLIERFTAQPI